MKRKLNIFGIIALALNAAAADRPIGPLEAKQGEQPNHLEPISPNLDAYEQLLQKRLVVTDGKFGTFLFRPSFSGEMAVAVYGTDYTKDPPLEPRGYAITVTEASENLYYAMPEHNNQHESKPVKIERTDIAIDCVLAVAIQRAWASMLLRTRYPSKAYAGVDGYVAQFTVFVGNLGWPQGEIWSPDHGLPKEFVELGFAVARYAKAPLKERPALRAKLLKQLRSFERRARNA